MYCSIQWTVGVFSPASMFYCATGQTSTSIPSHTMLITTEIQPKICIQSPKFFSSINTSSLLASEETCHIFDSYITSVHTLWHKTINEILEIRCDQIIRKYNNCYDQPCPEFRQFIKNRRRSDIWWRGELHERSYPSTGWLCQTRRYLHVSTRYPKAMSIHNHTNTIMIWSSLNTA